VSALAAQTRVEVALTLRRGESVLLTLGIPVFLLAFFSVVDVLPTGTDDPVDFLAPGVLALAVMSTAMVSLGIATGFDRGYGVLKRLGATPLGRPRLLAAKTVSIVAVEIVQLAVLVPVGLALGWRPGGGVGAVGEVVAVVVLASTAFAGLGFLLAGRLDPLVNLAAANGLYLVLLLVSGMLIPLGELPGWLRAVARLLPSGALAEALQGALSASIDIPGRAWVVLVAWAVAAPLAAAATFRWE